MSEHYLIGMDIGTTNVKAILMDENGTTVASASRQNHLILPAPGCVEQSADEWWENAAGIFRDIVIQAGPEKMTKLGGICISSQTVTMLPVDREGNAVRNALIWMDSRTSKEMHYISLEVGHDKFEKITGAQPDVAFLPNKMLWFRTQEPELFAKTDCFLQSSSYVNLKLTGERTTDMDQAVRTQCLDINTLQWSKEIGAACGIDFDRYLPAPVAPTTVIGRVTAEASGVTGLPEGTPVCAGASDAFMALYATGLSKLGEAAESSGTSSLVFAGCDHATPVDRPVVAKPCGIPGIPYLFDAPISASGASLKWYLDELGAGEKAEAAANNKNVYDWMNELAASVPAGSNGVIFFPYLLGERAPLWNSHARGMFIGISLDTERASMLRAVFEGTAFSIRHVVETIREAGGQVNSFRIAGGGAKSRTWAKIKASMLHVPVYLLDDRAGDIPFGDALCAGVAAGVFEDTAATVKKLIGIKEVIEPDEEWAAIYDRIYPFYIDLYRDVDKDLLRLKNEWNQINGTR